MRTFQATFLLSYIALFAACSATARGQAKREGPLPARSVVIDVHAPGRSLYKIAIPDLLGQRATGRYAAGVLRNDLMLSSLFEVLDPRSFLADPAKEGLSVDPKPWQNVGAQAVVKGKVTRGGKGYQMELRLYELGKSGSPSLSRTYSGSAKQLRQSVHRFANEILKTLTGQEGHFDTRLTFARRRGPGRKDVYTADYDGYGVSRVSRGQGVSMLPTFGPQGVWYSVLTKSGMFVTHSGMSGKPAFGGSGLNMGVAYCGGKIFFSSTRSGNAEIYSISPSGSGLKRLTRNSAIDVSPACGPGNQIAFVSSRHGNPQIFVMSHDGSGVRRVTYRGKYNQTPAWCMNPDTPLIAFTGRDRGTDIFTVNLKTGEYKRLTQGQGENKDPAFSPDCRMVAFASSRGGIFISNPDGLNQQRIVAGGGETLDWSN